MNFKNIDTSDSSNLKKTFFQFIKFSIVGVSNTLISLAIYYIFIFISKDLYMVGNVTGFVISVLNAFYWNNKYVFKAENTKFSQILLRLLKTYVSYGGTFLLTTLLLYLEVDVWHFNEYLAPIVNLCITVPLNFIFNKFWAMK